MELLNKQLVIVEQVLIKAYSSAGRAAVSKTAGRGFETCCACVVKRVIFLYTA